MYQQVLPGVVHETEKELAGRHVVGHHVEARTAGECIARNVQRRYQRRLYRRWWHCLSLALFQALLEQPIALLVKTLIAILEGLTGGQKTEQAQQAEAARQALPYRQAGS
ncbi:hypothetical protein OMR07_04625 [Methylobacterium organophilum]|nr:hypothetical protein [Methylobacterium organophilum]